MTPRKPTSSTIEPPTNIAGWGSDLAAENRPGVPQETEPAEPRAPAAVLPRQPGVPAHLRADLDKPPPVFGTAQPPHGLSGVLRRYAYQIPDNRPSHWLLLMGADRVDVTESAVSEAVIERPGRTAALVAGTMVGLWLVSQIARRFLGDDA